METKGLKQNLETLAQTQGDIINLLEDYFFAGNFEHQVGLIGNAIQEVVGKGASDSDASMDNDFAFTNRYIRESVHDLTELQKFLVRLHIVYDDYRRQYDDLLEA